ncbi:hypothetical protein HBE96_23285 [Clostridium sp. P21]|uniref:Phage protein n=1 Tax=Clostridium muellerianum TaxID=2716538 RepID=A0A7Y0HQV7_9CLOT|nr:hypothetical protein [Clostridium muellerianum]NMM65505.1 hypothetical protein [Clostridium muellerianum]
MQIGMRLIFDKQTGKILNGVLGEMQGDLQEGLRPAEIDFIDLPYGYNDNNFKEALEYHVDITKNKSTASIKDLIIIDKYIEHTETEEEKLKREKAELENQLLLKENKDLGGIL